MTITPNATILYDTTLRDGLQRRGVSLSVEDRLAIARRLDRLGIPFIEGGFPGAGPRDRAFFEELAAHPLTQAVPVAFGMVARSTPASEDEGLNLLAQTPVDAVTLVAKSSRPQIEKTLRVNPQQNLVLLGQSIKVLLAADKYVLIDAEHWFDGAKADPGYAATLVQAAFAAGASVVTLCDTNGGTMPSEVGPLMEQALIYAKEAGGRLGVHFHNDSGCAIACSLAAVEAGATVVQGSINGIGERCGNADLIVTAANLAFKYNDPVLDERGLADLTSTGHFVSEICNESPCPYQPYIGDSAFAHKGGIHASGIERSDGSYEHVDPAAVGNRRQIVVSELAGRASVRLRTEEMGYHLDDETARRLAQDIKLRERNGYSFEAADGSLGLLVEREQGTYSAAFELESFRVIAEKREDGKVVTEATVKVIVDGERKMTVAEGNGPVNALDRALRAAIGSVYPALADLKLTDYKVRVLDTKMGTDAVTRVLIDTSDGDTSFGTVGVSENIIEASWEALVDSIEFGLRHEVETIQQIERTGEGTLRE